MTDHVNGRQRCICQCHWDLSWMRFADTRIGAGDVDGLFIIERNAYFLYIETKGETEKIPMGQIITLNALARHHGCTVWILRGPKGYPTSIHVVKGGPFEPWEPTSREDVQRRIDEWFRWANRKPDAA